MPLIILFLDIALQKFKKKTQKSSTTSKKKIGFRQTNKKKYIDKFSIQSLINLSILQLFSSLKFSWIVLQSYPILSLFGLLMYIFFCQNNQNGETTTTWNSYKKILIFCSFSLLYSHFLLLFLCQTIRNSHSCFWKFC